MKEILGCILIIVITILLPACNGSNSDISNEPVDSDAMPVLSIGNQRNALGAPSYCIGNNGWIYKSGSNRIEKANIDRPDLKVIVYEDKELQDAPRQLSLHNGWIYFTASKEGVDYLYKVKEDGSEIDELAINIKNYALTESKIYLGYGINIKKNDDDPEAWYEEGANVSVMNLDGSGEKVVADTGSEFVGLSDGWILYQVGLSDYYRMTVDGKKENIWEVFDVDENEINPILTDGDYMFYNTENDFYMKKAGEKEVLIKGNSTCYCANKEDNWLYYIIDDAVYRTNIIEKGEEKLVYKFKTNSNEDLFADSILLNNGNVLLTKNDYSVYIKEDGTIIELSAL